MTGRRSLLLGAVFVVLAATAGAAWLEDARPRSAVQPVAQTISTRAEQPQPPALTADEERFATALWAVHREATRSAVAMSFAGIVYQTENRDARALAQKIERRFQGVESPHKMKLATAGCPRNNRPKPPPPSCKLPCQASSRRSE